MEASAGSEVSEATGGSYCHSILQVTALIEDQSNVGYSLRGRW
jgi:hypothetical protein